MKNEMDKAILEKVALRPMTASELAIELNINVKHIANRIQRLEGSGLVVPVGEKRAEKIQRQIKIYALPIHEPAPPICKLIPQTWCSPLFTGAPA